MPKYHDVVQGEYLSQIARNYGFTDYATIWNHGNNADLKKKRKNPQILKPGDRIFIPDREEKQETRSTEKKHFFRAKRPKLKLNLVLEDLYEEPIKNAKCEMQIDGAAFELTTDGKGKIEKEIPVTSGGGHLVVWEPDVSAVSGVQIPIKIGHLDPIDEVTGQKGRLNNLGYYAGEINDTQDMRFKSAVEEFQCDHKLTVDGDCGPQTQAKLKEAHGC